jgi:3-isopropylmalate/(R)-2-methylmalate dehydratase large subunit
MQTMLDKIWRRHLVAPEASDRPAILYIDLHLLHEVTSPQAFRQLAERGAAVRCPERCLAVADHSVPTTPPRRDGRPGFVDAAAEEQVRLLTEHCHKSGITCHSVGSPFQGIIHVVAPELGATRPGMTIVCGDSHTSTHGAFGALAFGIGSSEVAHVLASQCLLARKPRNFAITLSGRLQKGVGAKDLILAIIARLGMHGGTGHVFEYRGSLVRQLSMEARMTLCNMSIEAGARAGLVAPDETTWQWLAGRPYAPAACHLEEARAQARELCSDEDACFDQELLLDGEEIEPMVTWGTNPAQSVAINRSVPFPMNQDERKALEFMKITPGLPLSQLAVDVVFIGSCTNGRITDLRAAASLLAHHKVAPGVRVLVVPGSAAVRRQAEQEGLDLIFERAGCSWRSPGCSMCIAMNGDQLAPGELAVSTSNRNFEGRQGPGGRTLLASPLVAAAAAIEGRVCDPRPMLEVAHAAVAHH